MRHDGKGLCDANSRLVKGAHLEKVERKLEAKTKPRRKGGKVEDPLCSD